jgi:hypothetical protein
MATNNLNKLRSSVLYKDEVLHVKYTGKCGNFFRGKVIEARPRYARHSMLPYPQPKWIACCYRVTCEDGEDFEVAEDRYGKLYPGFEWIDAPIGVD